MASDNMNFSEMYFSLNNGVNMPAVGLGTLGLRSYQNLFNTLDHALEAGYRLFDTSAIYGNEKLLRNAFRVLLPKYGLDREEVFITTKLAPLTTDARFTFRAFERSLESLDTEYVDLYLLQYPSSPHGDQTSAKNARMRAETWLAITKLYDQSKIRAIGVSNFNIRHLMQLTEVMAVGPMVNQIEFHPYYYKPEMLDYCAQHNIRLQGYSTFGGLSQGNTSLMQDPVIKNIARRHEIPATKVLLLWALQKGVAIIPKSSDPDHLKENLQLNFRLTGEDMARLDALGDKNRKYSWDPATVA